MKGGEAVFDDEVGGVGVEGEVGVVLYDEGSDTAVVEVLYVVVAVSAFGAYGKEEGALGETEAAAVGEEPLYVSLALPGEACSYHAGYFVYLHGCVICVLYLSHIMSMASGVGWRVSAV